MNGLFVRNFDRENESPNSFAETTEPQTAHPRSIPIGEVDAMIEKARAESYAQGKLDGAEDALTVDRSNRAARADAALEVLAMELAELASKERRLRAELELEFTELLFGIGERILPDLFSQCIDDILVARIHSVARLIAGKGDVGIRLPEATAEYLKPRIEELLRQRPEETTEFEDSVRALIEIYGEIGREGHA